MRWRMTARCALDSVACPMLGPLANSKSMEHLIKPLTFYMRAPKGAPHQLCLKPLRSGFMENDATQRSVLTENPKTVVPAENSIGV